MTPASLTRAADLLSREPAYCGLWIQQHRTREGHTLEQQAAWLGCSIEQLQQLSLCFFPRPERWREDVTGLAAEYGCDAARLSRALLVDDPDGTGA